MIKIPLPTTNTDTCSLRDLLEVLNKIEAKDLLIRVADCDCFQPVTYVYIDDIEVTLDHE